jgi:hypothetical protein
MATLPNTLAVGSTLRLSNTHWVRRPTQNVYLGSYIDLTGGEVAKGFSELQEAVDTVNIRNAEIRD